MSNINYNYAIYHKHCLDGFTSLMILIKAKRLTRDAKIWHDSPSARRPPDNINNKDIIIMDVAYKYEVLKQIVERAKSVVFIDHHITIENDVKKLADMYKKKLTVIFDKKESGASLTWKFFYKKEKLPLLVKYIKDNDLWKHSMKYTKPVILGLRVQYNLDLKKNMAEKWLALFDNDNVKKLIKPGKRYLEHANAILEEHYRKHSIETFPGEKVYNDHQDHFTKPGQYTVAVVSGHGCPDTSSLGNKLVKSVDCDFAIMWTYNVSNKEYVISLRSNKVDVSDISKMFGGGGHKLAAAFTFNSKKYHIDDLFV
jgi:uncharacterized protein